MIPSRQGAVMAQLRRIFYYWVNLAMTLIAHGRPIVAITFAVAIYRCDSASSQNSRAGEPKDNRNQSHHLI
jgi:hypothetical protein